MWTSIFWRNCCHLADWGIQYCIKSEKAYGQLREVNEGLLSVSYSEFNDKYNQRDVESAAEHA